MDAEATKNGGKTVPAVTIFVPNLLCPGKLLNNNCSKDEAGYFPSSSFTHIYFALYGESSDKP